MSFFFLISSYNLSISHANQSKVNLQFNNVMDTLKQFWLYSMLLYTKGDTTHFFKWLHVKLMSHVPFMILIYKKPKNIYLITSYLFYFLFLLLFIICQIFTPINLMSMHNVISYEYIEARFEFIQYFCILKATQN